MHDSSERQCLGLYFNNSYESKQFSNEFFGLFAALLKSELFIGSTLALVFKMPFSLANSPIANAKSNQLATPQSHQCMIFSSRSFKIICQQAFARL